MKSFSHIEFADVLNSTMEKIKDLSKLKGAEYSGDNDRLLNFRRGGERMQTPMEVVWWIYANKHWDAITQACEDKQTGAKRNRLEGLAGRCDDLIVYLLLFKCMLIEAERPEITHTEPWKKSKVETGLPAEAFQPKMKPIIEDDLQKRYTPANPLADIRDHYPEVTENPELIAARQRAVDSIS